MFPAQMAKNSRGLPNCRHGSQRMPVGLAEHGHAKPGRFEHAVQDRHGKAGMIDVGVAGDEDDVHLIPAALTHLGRPASVGAKGAA